MRSKKYFLSLALLSAIILSSCNTTPAQSHVQTSEETSGSSEANIITTDTEIENSSSLPVFTDVKEILHFPQDLNEQNLIEYFKKAETLYVVTQGYVSANFYNNNGILYTDPDNKDYLPKQLGVDSITIEQFFELYYNVFTEDFADKILFEEGKQHNNSSVIYDENEQISEVNKIEISSNIKQYYKYDKISFFANEGGFSDMSLVTKDTYVKSITNNEIIYNTSIFQITPDLGYTDVHFEKGVLIDNKTGSTYTPDQSKGEHITSHDYSLKLQSDGSWKFDDFVFLY